jgi:hypothetical protein
MPWVKISKDAHNDMKQYLVDIEGLSLGELVECAFEFSMQNLKRFEAFLELEATDEDEKEQDHAKDDAKDESEDEED